MNKKELTELESDETWNHDRGELRPPVKNRRTVVSVAFPRDDLETVGRAAEQRRMKLSEFIRRAAVDQAITRAVVTSIVWEGTTSSGPFFISGGVVRGTAGPPLTEDKHTVENVAA